MNGLFFELLQIAIGNRKTLTRPLTDDEWASMYGICEKQALLGIAFAGVERLPKEQYPPFDVLAEWVHDAQVAKDRNEKLSKECTYVCELLAKNGISSCVIKGQSNIINYPEHLKEHRTCGDIDLWCLPRNNVRIHKGIANIVEYARRYRLEHNQPDIPWHRVLYYHVEINLDSGTEVELHYRPSYLNCFWRNIRLQNWFENNRQFESLKSPEGFPIPTNSFNAIYQLLHIYKHLFEEGIGLRQILDYYMVLRALHVDKRENPISNEDIMHTLGRFGMKKIASSIMYVLQEVFAMPDEYLICKPDEKEGKFLLNEIIQAGNFGKYDKRIKRVEGSYMKVQCNHAFEKWKHNLRLITHYPEEVLWEPLFRLYHFVWRKFRLWKF